MALGAALAAGGPAALTAQAPAADTVPHAGARAVLDLDLRLAEMASRVGLVAGGRALVSVGHGLRVGMAGHQVLKRLDDVPSRTGPGRSMSLGYAGAVVEWDLPTRWPVFARVFGGAGVITVRDQAVGTRVGSDIVGLIEPELATDFVRLGPVHLTAGVGYRLALSVDGPARIVAEDIRTPFVSLSLRVGPF